MWAVVCLLSARGGDASNWHNIDDNMKTCSDDWVYSVLMIGNILPNNQGFYEGCYQMAWPI